KGVIKKAKYKKIICEKVTKDNIPCPYCSTNDSPITHDDNNYLYFIFNAKTLSIGCEHGSVSECKVIFTNSIKLEYENWKQIINKLSQEKIEKLVNFAEYDFVNLRSNFTIHEFIKKYFTYGIRIELDNFNNVNEKLIEIMEKFIIDFNRVCRKGGNEIYAKSKFSYIDNESKKDLEQINGGYTYNEYQNVIFATIDTLDIYFTLKWYKNYNLYISKGKKCYDCLSNKKSEFLKPLLNYGAKSKTVFACDKNQKIKHNELNLFGGFHANYYSGYEMNPELRVLHYDDNEIKQKRLEEIKKNNKIVLDNLKNNCEKKCLEFLDLLNEIGRAHV